MPLNNGYFMQNMQNMHNPYMMQMPPVYPQAYGQQMMGGF